MNWVHDDGVGHDGDEENEDEDGTANKVERTRCKFCERFRHTADKCPKAKAKSGEKGAGSKGKSKGKEGGGGGG